MAPARRRADARAFAEAGARPRHGHRRPRPAARGASRRMPGRRGGLLFSHARGRRSQGSGGGPARPHPLPVRGRRCVAAALRGVRRGRNRVRISKPLVQESLDAPRARRAAQGDHARRAPRRRRDQPALHCRAARRLSLLLEGRGARSADASRGRAGPTATSPRPRATSTQPRLSRICSRAPGSRSSPTSPCCLASPPFTSGFVVRRGSGARGRAAALQRDPASGSGRGSDEATEGP
jgi:hypothetical protein